jgi:AraC-like DNA-binding protein
MLIANKKYDPSENRQHFNNILLRIHCCRYWQLSEWEFNNMAFPFWRLYHNEVAGARVLFNGSVTYLTADKLVIIPPNTSYSNALKTNEGSVVFNERITGEKIEEKIASEELERQKLVDHLFIHFNLGIPYDFVKPGIYTVPALAQSQFIEEIKEACISSSVTSLSKTFELHSFITGIISLLPDNIWNNTNIDKRIFRIIEYIEKNLSSNLTNEGISQIANMATNSFARLFKQNMRETLQHYIVRRRVEKAQLLLHHSDNSIDNVATECGFCDRYHFSKAFKSLVDMSPAVYRKMHNIQR